MTITDESLKELGVRWGIFNPTEAAHRVSGSLDANGFSNISNNLNVNFATTVTPAGSLALQVACLLYTSCNLKVIYLSFINNLSSVFLKQ